MVTGQSAQKSVKCRLVTACSECQISKFLARMMAEKPLCHKENQMGIVKMPTKNGRQNYEYIAGKEVAEFKTIRIGYAIRISRKSFEDWLKMEEFKD